MHRGRARRRGRFQISELGLMLHDLPLNWDNRQRDTVRGYAVPHDPDTTLAHSCILPNKVRLARAEEVCSTSDMPLNWDSGKRDTIGGYAVVHDPDSALAGGCILPNKVCLAVPVEVFSNRF